MAQKVAEGIYSRAMMSAIEVAEAMQARAVLAIKDGYATRTDQMVTLDNLTYEQFMKTLSAADRSGRREELEGELAQMMMGAMQTIMAAEAVQQQQQGQQ